MSREALLKQEETLLPAYGNYHKITRQESLCHLNSLRFYKPNSLKASVETMINLQAPMEVPLPPTISCSLLFVFSVFYSVFLTVAS